MGPFEFYLSFYGLLLGLSVAAVASGMLDAIGARHRVRIGRLTMLLAVFVFFDITSFWVFLWGFREYVTVSPATMVGGLVVALIYYASAGLVFPRNVAEWPDLDEHHRRNKRLVTGGVLLANVIVMAVTIPLHAAQVAEWTFWLLHLTYWPMLLALLFSKNDRLDFVLYVILVGGQVANVVVSTWVLQ